MSVLTDTDLKKIINKRDIGIYPLNEGQITGVGYDLSIGKIIPLTQIEKFVDDGKTITIPPNCYCLLITKEFVWLSKKYLGTLHARGTLAAKGLYTNCTNVDPNFNGQMIMSVYNISEVDVIINKETNPTFITLIFHRVNLETNTLVGDKITKNATRVTSQMLKEIYVGDKYDKHRQQINELQTYLLEERDKHFTEFDKIIKAASSVYISYDKKRLGAFWGKIKGGSVSGFFQVLQIAAALLCGYFLLEMIIDFLKNETLTTEESRIAEAKRLIVLLLVAIVTLLDKAKKSR